MSRTRQVGYADRVRSARRWVALTTAANLVLLAWLLYDLRDRANGGVWPGLLRYDATYVALLVAYAVLLGRSRPRPWLTLGVLAAAVADGVIWVPVLTVGADPLLALATLPGKLGLLWSLGHQAVAAFKQRRDWGGASRLDPALGAAVAMLGVLGAGPNWEASNVLHDLWMMRRRRAECRANLKSWYVAQRSYFEEHDRYAEDMERVGFAPERGNRFAYFASREGPVQARDTAKVSPGAYTGVSNDRLKFQVDGKLAEAIDRSRLPPGLPLGVVGRCPEHCAITAACAANLDRDPTLDVWSISTADRALLDGGTIAAGQTIHEVDDAED